MFAYLGGAVKRRFSAVVVQVATELAAPPAQVWDAVKQPDTLRYITRGPLDFRPLGPIPDRLDREEQAPWPRPASLIPMSSRSSMT